MRSVKVVSSFAVLSVALLGVAVSTAHAGKKVVRHNLHMLTAEETKAKVLSRLDCEFIEMYSRRTDHPDEGVVKLREKLDEKSLNEHGVFVFYAGNGFGGSRTYHIAFGESQVPHSEPKAVYFEIDRWETGIGTTVTDELIRMKDFMPGELRVYEKPYRYYHTTETPTGQGVLRRDRNDGKLIGPDYVDLNGYIAVLNCKSKPMP